MGVIYRNGIPYTIGNPVIKGTTYCESKNMILSTSSWNNNQYTINDDRIAENSYQEIVPRQGIDAAQLSAFQEANIQQFSQATGRLSLKAYGTVPTTDIPITIIFRTGINGSNNSSSSSSMFISSLSAADNLNNITTTGYYCATAANNNLPANRPSDAGIKDFYLDVLNFVEFTQDETHNWQIVQKYYEFDSNGVTSYWIRFKVNNGSWGRWTKYQEVSDTTKKVEIIETLLADNWNEDTYTISNNNISANNTIFLTYPVNIDSIAYTLLQNAKIRPIAQAEGSLTLQALGAIPQNNIDIKLIIWG